MKTKNQTYEPTKALAYKRGFKKNRAKKKGYKAMAGCVLMASRHKKSRGRSQNTD